MNPFLSHDFSYLQYQSDKQKHKEAIDDLKRQEKELEKLEDSIRQIHQYFVDIATLIQHQVINLRLKWKVFEFNL